MKLVFIHTAQRLKEDKNGNLYTDGSYNNEIWDRYLALSNNLSVVFRKDGEKYDIEYARKMFNPLNKKIKFIELKNRMSSIKEYLNIKTIRLNKNTIEGAVKDCDYLIVRGGGYAAIKYARKYNKPYLVEVVGCPWDSLWNHSFKGKVLALSSYLKMKKVIKDAPYVVYVTNEFLQSRYPNNGKSIGCSDVVLPTLDKKILEKRINKIKNMSANKPTLIGTTGAIDVAYKGQEYVIRAISILINQGYNFEYHLVGGGDNTYLKSVAEKCKISNKVKFLGSLPHDDVFEYLDNIDIYIQPSKTEGLPRALVEAMSRGCPVLGSKVGGIPELLNEEYTFDVGSINEICNLLKELDKENMIRESKRSFNKSKEFDKRVLDKRRADFYMEFTNTLNEYKDQYN